MRETDYYPFGMLMPERKFSSDSYRYGFNGKEKDKDIGEDDYDFSARIYDGRVGRWLTLDKVNKADKSPYQYCSGNPVNYIDPNGKDEIHFYFLIKTKEVYISFYPRPGGIVQQVPIGPVTATWNYVKKSGPDEFYHHAVTINTTSNTVSDRITEFHPTIPGSRSGLTSESFLGISRKDRDYATVIKYSNGNEGIQQYFHKRLLDPSASLQDRNMYANMEVDRPVYNTLRGASHYGQMVSGAAAMISTGAGLIGGLRAALTALGEGGALKLGWKVGDPITNLTVEGNVPKWNTVRQRFWKNEALFNGENYSEFNVNKMQKGLAPQFENPSTGVMESMELHHHTLPQRSGGLFDFIKVTPEQHAAIDPFRILKK